MSGMQKVGMFNLPHHEFEYLWNQSKKAISKGDLDAAKVIQKKGADLFVHIDIAAEKGFFNIVKHIEDSYQLRSHSWENCLHGAAKGGQLEIFKYAESKGVSDSSIQDSAAHAARRGHFNIVKHIISGGCILANYYIGSAQEGRHEEIYKYCIDNCGLTSVPWDRDYFDKFC
uniref:Ankyrin repeat protein n=1 Tax=Pithovirus LCPAC403 TaxID=2506596 RepID=A0A481ZCV3_9VIRU|nr:MAG: ankyrin repeat protein [Pithovirus LCPAC403]